MNNFFFPTSLDAVRFSPFHNFKSLKLYQNLDIKFLITVGEYESKSFKDQAKKFSAVSIYIYIVLLEYNLGNPALSVIRPLLR